MQEVGQIAMKKPVLPHGRQQALEIVGLDGPGQRPLGGFQKGQQVLAVALEQGRHDGALVTEVVVEIPRADAQRLGDVIGGHIAFPFAVEEGKAGVEDAFLGAGHCRPNVVISLPQVDS